MEDFGTLYIVQNTPGIVEYALDWDVCDELENIIAEYMEMER